jgi:predicted N-formylglutamate amidohydrolase
LRSRSSGLLVAGDAHPAIVEKTRGCSPIVLFGDHAGRAIPARLGDLGLSGPDRDRHIAWDIGVAGLGRALSARLDAVFIRQRYSRLVIDCNRAPGAPGSIAEVSDGTHVPGNQGLDAEASDARRREVFQPYQDAIAQVVGERAASGRRTLLFSLHSFTPVMAAFERPWRFGILHRGDSVFSQRMLEALRTHVGEAVGDNQPYAMDNIDFTIPFHADANGLDYVELEVRQDLIATAMQQSEMAGFLAPVIGEVLSAMG